VAFVLDLSSGDLDLIYRVSLPFIRQVASGLPLRPDRVRLAFVTAVNTPTVHFYFNTYRYMYVQSLQSVSVSTQQSLHLAQLLPGQSRIP